MISKFAEYFWLGLIYFLEIILFLPCLLLDWQVTLYKKMFDKNEEDII